MVKMSETIICQRFIQNTWKKDLCSNCFKSKEDHVVVPEKKITYRWTSHVDNFPQHGILRRSKKSEKPKTQTVSFQIAETEIIGFGGEEYSSDDELYVNCSEENSADTENEEEEKEFRKLTQSNTDFNSVPANLKNDKTSPNKYSNLKLGKPLTDSEGRKQTLQVIVEPFKNSVTVNGLANERKIHLNKILLEGSKESDEKTENETGRSNDSKIDLSREVVCDMKTDMVDRPVNITSVNVNETVNQDIYLKCNGNAEINADKLLKITNVLVNAPKVEDEDNKEVIENMKNAKTKLEPLFKLGAYENGKMSVFQNTEVLCNGDSENTDDSITIASLPLIKSKELEIEIDQPGSREMVGEPDGKADSDDSADPLVTPETKSETVSVSANPQRSFLHGLIKEKPTPVSKPLALQNGGVKNNATEPVIPNSVPSTPKMQISVHTNTGSTKRQAPKPPTPKISPQTPSIFAQTPDLTPIITTNGLTNSLPKKYDTPTVNGIDESKIAELKNNVKRRLNMDMANQINRNSLNILPISANVVETKPNGISNGTNGSICLKDEMENTRSEMENGNARSATKCSRSLSCDSIISPSLALSEKNRKYSGATIKVKSTLRKFLRFNSKDDDKAENEVPIPPLPRRRIEIIHPLDLNKSSIEILRPASEEPKVEAEEIKIIPPCPATRPTKPPPPPRTQSLDQKIVSEISKPIRPPPPKSINLKPPPKFECISKTSANVYENLGESRQGIAPAKPQRASSMRDRARQNSTNEENSCLSDREAVPECDQQTETCETPSTSSITYCGSETESELYQSVASSNSDIVQNDSDVLLDGHKKNKSVVHESLEDNYNAVVITNHETLSQLLEQIVQTTLIPNALKILQTTLHIRFEHFVIIENSRIIVGDWNFYNAKWTGHDVVVSISNKPLGPMKSLPSCIILSPLVKFTDMIPSRYLKADSSVEETNAYITVWNEQKIESISTYKKPENLVQESGLLLTQLMNALTHLQACGVEDISLNEIFICKRETDSESKLLILPISIDYAAESDSRMSLCKGVPVVLNMLLLKQHMNEVLKRILNDNKVTSLSQAKAVAEYWLWGPCDVTFTSDRQPVLQRWLDLERATFLHKIICKRSTDFSLYEKCHLMFLVRTNAKLLMEASYLLEKK